MRIKVWTRNDESGLLDGEFRDGDPDSTYDDSWIPGGQEPKSWLIIEVPDPPNLTQYLNASETPPFLQGENLPADETSVRHKRRYYLDWRAKFDGEEIATIENVTEVLADGSTSQGGTVSGGVVSGLFSHQDFQRKR